jgi:mono/diheme cytochrome c family protein
MKYVMYVGAAMLAAAVTATASMQQKTVRDKVYTKEQATKASEQFEKFCAKCHIKEKVPEGKKPGPSLTGEEFLDNWQDRTVEELLENIYTTMPNDGATTLTKEETADLAALILQMNKYPDGPEPLKYDDSAKAIVIVK